MNRATLTALAAAALSWSSPVLRAELQWEKPWQEFHRRPQDGAVETEYAFKNSGPGTVTIRKVKTTCGCTTAKLEKYVYAPGERGSIAVKFMIGDRVGPHRKAITVLTDEKPEPTELNLVVFIQEVLEVRPALVFWRQGEAPSSKSVRLTAAVNKPVQIKKVTSSDPRLIARLETVKPGQEYTVVITPTETGEKITAQVTVETDFPADAPVSYTIHARIK